MAGQAVNKQTFCDRIQSGIYVYNLDITKLNMIFDVKLDAWRRDFVSERINLGFIWQPNCFLPCQPNPPWSTLSHIFRTSWVSQKIMWETMTCYSIILHNTSMLVCNLDSWFHLMDMLLWIWKETLFWTKCATLKWDHGSLSHFNHFSGYADNLW